MVFVENLVSQLAFAPLSIGANDDLVKAYHQVVQLFWDQVRCIVVGRAIAAQDFGAAWGGHVLSWLLPRVA